MNSIIDHQYDDEKLFSHETKMIWFSVTPTPFNLGNLNEFSKQLLRIGGLSRNRAIKRINRISPIKYPNR